jgi:transposase
VLIAEIGVDMSAFPTPKHLGSWAKVSPGNDQSAGKRRSGKAGKGNKWLPLPTRSPARASQSYAARLFGYSERANVVHRVHRGTRDTPSSAEVWQSLVCSSPAPPE